MQTWDEVMVITFTTAVFAPGIARPAEGNVMSYSFGRDTRIMLVALTFLLRWAPAERGVPVVQVGQEAVPQFDGKPDGSVLAECAAFQRQFPRADRGSTKCAQRLPRHGFRLGPSARGQATASSDSATVLRRVRPRQGSKPRGPLARVPWIRWWRMCQGR